MKKFIARILVLSIMINLLTGGIVYATNEEGALKITVDSIESAERGDEVTVNVVANEAENIGALTIRIGYDESELEYVSHQGYNLPNGDGISMYHNTTAHWIQYSVTSSLAAWTSSDGMTVFSMTFKVLDSASGLSSLDVKLDNLVVSTYEGDSVDAVIVNGGINVVVPLTGIELDVTNLMMNVEDTEQLSVIEMPTDTTESLSVEWKSSNTDVAVVDNNGLVTALSAGTANITAQVGDHIATCSVEVESPLTGISLDKTAVTINQGDTSGLSVIYSPEDTTDEKTVMWSTTDDKVATVDEGLITGVGEGTATIKATVGQYSAECIVTVERIEITEEMVSGISDNMYLEYTGEDLEPEVVVMDGITTLEQDVDYTVTYSNNTDKGIAEVVIEGKGKYKGTVIKTFEIVANMLEDSMVADMEDYIYTGDEIIPDVEVKDGDKSLTENVDYAISCQNNINVGTATVTITGENNYGGSLEKTFEITQKSISNAVIDDIANVTYNRTAQLPIPVVTDGKTVLVEGQDYTLSYTDNTNTGTAKVIVTGKGNYYGEISETFIIDKASTPTITFPTAEEATYGTTLEQVSLIGTSEFGVFEWEDKTIVPSVGTNNYTVVFVANEDTSANYEISDSVEADIEVTVKQATPAIDVDAVVFDDTESSTVTLTAYLYNVGEGAVPTGVVIFMSGEDELGTVSLSNGTATLEWLAEDDLEYSIVAKYLGDSNYTENEDTIAIDLTKIEQTIVFEEIDTKTYGDDAFLLSLKDTLGYGGVTYTSSNEDVITIEDNKATIVGAGDVVITATIEEDNIYQSAKTQISITVNKKEVTFSAVDETVRRGEAMPEFTYEVEGLVETDEVLQDPTIVASTTDTNTQGTYELSFSTAADIENASNYTLNYENGEFTVDVGFTVSFVESNGSEIDTITDVLYGDTISAEEPTKDQYIFEGWYEDADYKEEFDFSQGIVEDTIIYAKFTAVGVLDNSMVTDIEDVIYNGSEVIPSVEIKDGDNVLVENVDYTITYQDNINVGTATIAIVGQNNYSGTLNITFDIIPKSIVGATISDIESVIYNKTAHLPVPVVMDGNTTLVEGEDFTVSYENNTNAGTAEITILGKGNYSGELYQTFVIEKASAPIITFPTAEEITYGKTLEQVSLIGTSEFGIFKWEDETIVPSVEIANYKVGFEANEDTLANYEAIDVTEADIEIIVNQATPALEIGATTSVEQGSGTVILTVAVSQVGEGEIPTGQVVFYNGAEELGTLELNNGTATLEWMMEDDTECEVTVKYLGNSNYTSSEESITIDIAKKDQTIEFEEISQKTYGDEAFTLNLKDTVGDGSITYTSSDVDVVKIEGDKAIILSAGEVVITAVIEEDDVYQSATTQISIIVNKKDVTISAVDETIRRGEPMPEFTYKVDGLISTDKIIQAPEIVASTMDTNTKGVYELSFSKEATIENADNYIIKYENAKLTIDVGFTVIFTESDGTEIGNITDILYGDKIEAINEPTKDNYIFEGWYVDTDYKEEFDFSQGITQDQVIYAKFVAVKELDESMVEGIENAVYNGKEIVLSIVIKDGNKVLVENEDYSISYKNNINAGIASVIIVGQNSYSGTVIETFVITPKTISDATISDIASVLYNRTAHSPRVFVVDGQTVLTEGKDYVVSYANNTNAGTAQVIVTGICNYSGQIFKTFTIEKASAPVIVFPTTEEITYGQALEQVSLIGLSEYGVFEWKDETIIPSVNINNYKVVFVPNEDTIANYETIEEVEADVEVKVNQATPVIDVSGVVQEGIINTSITLTAMVSKTGQGDIPTGEVIFYNGTESLGTAKLSDGIATLEWQVEKNIEYEIIAQYSGDSNYTSSEDTISFDLDKKVQTIAFEEIDVKTYGDEAFELILRDVLGDGSITFTSSNESVIVIEGDKAIIAGAGEVIITAEIAEDDIYQSATAQIQIIVNKKEVTFSVIDKTVKRGEPMPEFTYKVEGLVGADQVTQQPEISASTVGTKTQGIYDLSFSTTAEIENASNYIIMYENAKLTVDVGFTVTLLDSDGSEISTITDVLYGDTVKVENNPTKEQYVFEGWYVNSDCKEEFDFTTAIIEDTAIYAKFTVDIDADRDDYENPEVDVDTESDTDNTAGTGDNNGLYLFIVLLALASMGIAIILRRKIVYKK